MIKAFRGVGVALVTPFNKDLSIDHNALEKLVDHVSRGNVDYLVVMGTTGESPTLSWSEKLQVLERVTTFNKKELPIVYGHGGNNTNELVSKLDDLKDFGLSGILSVCPYYNRPSQEGIFRHFTKIADTSPFDVILYDVPARTSSSISVNTVLRLAEHDRIAGLKDATGNLNHTSEIASKKPDDFLLLSGDDSLILPVVNVGGEGVISVLANLLPAHVSLLTAAALNGPRDKALELNHMLDPFFRLIVKEGNPSSIKAGLASAGLIRNYTRLPLTPGSEGLMEEFKRELDKIKKGS